MSSLAPGPYVKFHEDFTTGKHHFKAGQTILAPVFQRVLEEAGQLDSVKYPRPEFHCVQCDKPVRFRRKSVSKRDEREVTRVATFVGNREEHTKSCLFSRSSNEVRETQNGGVDVGDRNRPFITHLIEPEPPRASSLAPAKEPFEADGEVGVPIAPHSGRQREVRNHRTSQLAAVVDSYERVIEEYPDVPGNWKDPEVALEQRKVRDRRREALSGMGLMLPGDRQSSYGEAFRQVLSKDPEIEKRGEYIWFAKMSKVLICNDGLIIIAHGNKNNPEANAGVVLELDVNSPANRAFMDELKEALTYYVFGQVVEKEFQGKTYRFVTPKHLAWIHPGEHPFWGYGKVKVEETGKTLAQMLAPPVPSPAPAPAPPQPAPSVPEVIPEPSRPVTPAPEPTPTAASTAPPHSLTGKTTSPPVQPAPEQKNRGFWATIMGWLGLG